MNRILTILAAAIAALALGAWTHGVGIYGTVIPSNFFGLAIIGPIEPNIGGSGKPIIWPTWSPTSFRVIGTFGPVPINSGNYYYLTWDSIETSDGVYNWALFDEIWAKLISEDVTDVVMALSNIPQWVQVGNAYSFSATVAASTGVVTATSNNYSNGWRVFFTGGTTGPFTAGTVYYVVNLSGNTFQLSATSGGSPITGGGSGSSTITAADTPPANMAKLTAWIEAVAAEAITDGLPIKFFENVNEFNNGPGFWVGSYAELTSMQQAIYAAKAVYPSIQVLSPPVNTLGAAPILNVQSFLQAGGGTYSDIIAFHGYPSDLPGHSQTLYATEIGLFKTMLASNGQSGKPIWNTEYSSLSGVPATDETWLAATSFIDWSNGVARKFYYAYDGGSPSDILWSPPNVTPPNGALNVAGVAYQQIVNWMTGAFLSTPCSINGVIWTCGLTRGGGYQAQAVWTSDGSTPTFSVPGFATQYRDLAGATHGGLGVTVTLGANPILLESGAPSYYAPAVALDGSTYLSLASVTSTDNQYLSYSFWIRADAPAPANSAIFATDPTGTYGTGWGWFSSTLDIFWKAQASKSQVTASVNTRPWTNVIVSINGNASSNYIAMYVNGVKSTLTPSSLNLGTTIPFNGLQLVVGGDPYSENWTGALADVWIAPGVNLLDGSGNIPAATLAKFINANGKPVYLGSTCQLPTGSAPAICLSGNSTTFPTNLGSSGGTFTVNGDALANATSSPSDY